MGTKRTLATHRAMLTSAAPKCGLRHYQEGKDAGCARAAEFEVMPPIHRLGTRCRRHVGGAWLQGTATRPGKLYFAMWGLPSRASRGAAFSTTTTITTTTTDTWHHKPDRLLHQRRQHHILASHPTCGTAPAS